MASALLRLSLCAVAGVAAAAGTGEDAAALLQVGAAVERADACQCLSWKDVFEKHGLKCGAGPELESVGGYEARDLSSNGHWMYNAWDICTLFFEKVSANFCVQKHIFQQRKEQWCYVSPQCEALNGGSAVGGLKWKECRPGEDRMLGQMSVPEVFKAAQAEDQDPALFLKMAYPIYQDRTSKNFNIRWEEAKPCISHPFTMSENCFAVMTVQMSGSPMIFSSHDRFGMPPYGVVHGRKAYETQLTRWSWDNHDNKLALYSAKSKICNLTCVKGCES